MPIRATKFKQYRGIPHCQRCGSLENLFVHGSRKTKKGLSIFHYCRPCNTERHRRYRDNGGMVKVVEANIRYQKKNPKRLRAWQHARKIKRQPCQVCAASKTHRHHPDVDKRFLITFLCPLHHKQVHRGLLICPPPMDLTPQKV